MSRHCHVCLQKITNRQQILDNELLGHVLKYAKSMLWYSYYKINISTKIFNIDNKNIQRGRIPYLIPLSGLKGSVEIPSTSIENWLLYNFHNPICPFFIKEKKKRKKGQ